LKEQNDREQLLTAQDWLLKAQHDFLRFQADDTLYSLVDCMLTLNALPDWAPKDHRDELKKPYTDEVVTKIKIGDLAEIDINSDKFYLYLTRCYCNHAKHNQTAMGIVKIEKIEGIILPARLPAKFKFVIKFYNMDIYCECIIQSLLTFWEKEIGSWSVDSARP